MMDENMDINDLENTENEAEKAPEEECIIVEEPNQDKFSFINNRILLAVGVFAFLVLCLFIYMINVPSKRFARAIKKADALYYESKFERSSKYYTKAIGILPDSVRGYLGTVRAGSALSEYDRDDYIQKAEIILSLAAIKDGEEAECLEFFLMAPELLTDPFELRDLLLRAYDFMDEPKELRAAIADASNACVANMEPSEEALVEVDRVLEFSGNASSFYDNLSKTVEAFVIQCTVMDEYEKAYSALDKYGPVLGNDEESLRARVDNSKMLYDTKLRVMGGVSDILGPYYDSFKDSFSEDAIRNLETPLFRVMDYDFSGMLLIDGSHDADILALDSMPAANVYYESGFDGNGVTAGLYPYGEPYTDENGNIGTAYYFYYGEYKDGIRNGYGISIIKTDSSSFMAFEGNWENDAPSGFGVLYKNDMYSYTSLAKYRQVIFGNWQAGNAEGEMKSMAVLNEHPDTYFAGSYSAESGNLVSLPGELTDYGIVEPVADGLELVACLGSITDGYDYFLPIYAEHGTRLSVFGY